MSGWFLLSQHKNIVVAMFDTGSPTRPTVCMKALLNSGLCAALENYWVMYVTRLQHVLLSKRKFGGIGFSPYWSCFWLVILLVIIRFTNVL